MNYALITVDSLRADHVSCYGYERDTTPNIDELASESIVFSDAVAHACATRPSFPSLLTSTHGMHYGGFSQLSMDQIPVALPFKDHDFATGGFHSNPFLSEAFGYSRGFDRFSTMDDNPSITSRVRRYVSNNLEGPVHDLLEWFYNKTQEHAGVDVGSYYQDAVSLTDEALEWVSTVEEPWFLWVHYMDPHHPYVPPVEYQLFREAVPKRRGVKLRQRVLEDPESLNDDEWADLIGLYDAEIRFVDAEIQRLIAGLNQTTWVLTADHGEEFYDHGNFGHKNRFYEEHVHVPLILGGTKETGIRDDLVGLNDVPVTLIREAGIDVPETYRGQHVLDGSRERVVGGYADGSGTEFDTARLMSRTSDEKYIRDMGDGTVELYDLRDDREEQENLVGQRNVGDHDAAVDEFISEAENQGGDIESIEVGKAIEERLEHLGYQ